MKDDKWQLRVVGTSDFYLSLVICHLLKRAEQIYP